MEYEKVDLLVKEVIQPTAAKVTFMLAHFLPHTASFTPFLVLLQVVISSSWKDVPRALKKITKALTSRGVEVLGRTPMLDFSCTRVVEIRCWLVDTKQEGKLNVTHWVAIDDMVLSKMSFHSLCP